MGGFVSDNHQHSQNLHEDGGEDKEVHFLRELQKNCDRTQKEIANSCNISDVQVTRLKQKVASTGKVRGYKAVLDPMAFGFRILAFVVVRLKERGHASSVEMSNFIAELECVQEVHNIMGKYDLLVKVRVRETEDVVSFMQKVNERKEVQHSKIFSLGMGTVKETTDLAI